MAVPCLFQACGATFQRNFPWIGWRVRRFMSKVLFCFRRYSIPSADYLQEGAAYEGKPLPQMSDVGEVYGEWWGMTRPQLRLVLELARKGMMIGKNGSPEVSARPWKEEYNMRDFVEAFVKPVTKGMGMGLSLLLNRDNPQKVNVMVSHCWDENAAKFIQDVIDNIAEHEVVFICALALYQNQDGKGPSVPQQLGSGDIEESPFFRVLQTFASVPHRGFERISRGGSGFGAYCEGLMGSINSSCGMLWYILSLICWCWVDKLVYCCECGYRRGRMLVVANQELLNKGEGLYSRLWCAFEAASARALHVPVDFAEGTTPEMLHGPSARSCKDGRCACPFQSSDVKTYSRDDHRQRSIVDRLEEERAKSKRDAGVTDELWARSLRIRDSSDNDVTIPWDVLVKRVPQKVTIKTKGYEEEVHWDSDLLLFPLKVTFAVAVSPANYDEQRIRASIETRWSIGNCCCSFTWLVVRRGYLCACCGLCDCDCCMEGQKGYEKIDEALRLAWEDHRVQHGHAQQCQEAQRPAQQPLMPEP